MTLSKQLIIFIIPCFQHPPPSANGSYQSSTNEMLSITPTKVAYQCHDSHSRVGDLSIFNPLQGAQVVLPPPPQPCSRTHTYTAGSCNVLTGDDTLQPIEQNIKPNSFNLVFFRTSQSFTPASLTYCEGYPRKLSPDYTFLSYFPTTHY